MSREQLSSKAFVLIVVVLALFVAIVPGQAGPSCKSQASRQIERQPSANCPVTHPNGSLPPGNRSLSEAEELAKHIHGNGEIWVSMPESGVWELLHSQESDEWGDKSKRALPGSYDDGRVT
jgi:hypothetical protein